MLLIPDYPLQVLPKLAEKIGLNEAIFLQQLHYWLIKSKVDYADKKWVYNTVDKWKEQFPFWSEKTIRRTVESLRQQGLIQSVAIRQNAFDQTLYYTINYQSDQLDLVKMTNSRDGQNDRSDLVKMTNSSSRDYITEITTETTKTYVIPDGINREAWDEWVDFRKSKKKTISRQAAQKQFKMLLEYPEIIQSQIINRSIQNDYQGLFPPQGDTYGQANKNGFSAGGSRDQNRKLSAVERVDQNIARDRAARQAAATGRNGGNLEPDDTHVRAQMDGGLRGDGGRRQRMGSVLEGDYDRTD